jgi:soluble cytochrome b562
MKLRTLWLVGFAVMVTGCAEKEQPVAKTEDVAAAAAEAMPEVDAAAMGTEAFVKHMHVHAEQLDKITAALSFGNLEAAQTPAYWLSRHDGVTGPLYDWESYLDQMRGAAAEIADASDLATARAAAGRIVEGCQGCHAATGVEVVIAVPATQ